MSSPYFYSNIFHHMVHDSMISQPSFDTETKNCIVNVRSLSTLNVKPTIVEPIKPLAGYATGSKLAALIEFLNRLL